MLSDIGGLTRGKELPEKVATCEAPRRSNPMVMVIAVYRQRNGEVYMYCKSLLIRPTYVTFRSALLPLRSTHSNGVEDATSESGHIASTMRNVFIHRGSTA